MLVLHGLQGDNTTSIPMLDHDAERRSPGSTELPYLYIVSIIQLS